MFQGSFTSPARRFVSVVPLRLPRVRRTSVDGGKGEGGLGSSDGPRLALPARPRPSTSTRWMDTTEEARNKGLTVEDSKGSWTSSQWMSRAICFTLTTTRACPQARERHGKVRGRTSCVVEETCRCSFEGEASLPSARVMPARADLITNTPLTQGINNSNFKSQPFWLLWQEPEWFFHDICAGKQ